MATKCYCFKCGQETEHIEVSIEVVETPDGDWYQQKLICKSCGDEAHQLVPKRRNE